MNMSTIESSDLETLPQQRVSTLSTLFLATL
jgi:hypothetical protein